MFHANKRIQLAPALKSCTSGQDDQKEQIWNSTDSVIIGCRGEYIEVGTFIARMTDHQHPIVLQNGSDGFALIEIARSIAAIL